MKNLIGLLFLLFSFIGAAQHEHTQCGSEDVLAEIKKHPKLYQKYLEGKAIQRSLAQRAATKKSTDQVYIIPVVYHVIYWDSTDNISDAQLMDGIDVLNEDFRRMNADTSNTRSLFKGLGADIGVEFRLAQKDPQGNATTGIRRIQNQMTINAAPEVRLIDAWPNEHYFNIWVVRKIQEGTGSGGTTTLGYSFRPYPGQTGEYDGMVVRHDQVGRIGTASSLPFGSNQRGRTMTHEAGHYLGLAHTFELGCDEYYNVGDGVDDTPPVAAANFQCDFNANSCHNDSVDLPDMVENYMDYAPGSCMNIFTKGQKKLMRACFESANLREMLIRQSNLERTGVLGVAEQVELNTFKLYPNPANGWFTVEAQSSLKGRVVSLTDISGKEIETWKVLEEGNSFRVNLEDKNLKPGVYMVGIFSASGASPSYHKLMIQ